MAKRIPRTSLEEVFSAQSKPVEAPTPKQAWAVRQKRGPEEHAPLVFMAVDVLDAQGQFFNYYNLGLQTHRYQLECVLLPEDHELAASAIECHQARFDQETNLQELANQAYSDVQSALAGKG
jgi:hypothetical protein